MRFGICVSAEEIAIAERSGYDYVEFAVATVAPEIGEAEFQALKTHLSGLSIKPEAWNKFIPNELPLVGEHVDFAKITDFVRTTLDRIGQLSGEVIVFGSAGARNIPEDFPRDRAHEQLVRFLQMTADVAAENNIQIVIEPVLRRACNVLNSVSEAAVLAQEVDRPEIKVLADLFHMAAENEPMEAISETADNLHHVHLPVPDVPGLSTPSKTYPHPEFLRELWRINYRHRASVEDLGKRFVNLEREAPLVLSYLKETWQGFST